MQWKWSSFFVQWLCRLMDLTDWCEITLPYVLSLLWRLCVIDQTWFKGCKGGGRCATATALTTQPFPTTATLKGSHGFNSPIVLPGKMKTINKNNGEVFCWCYSWNKQKKNYRLYKRFDHTSRNIFRCHRTFCSWMLFISFVRIYRIGSLTSRTSPR